MDLIPEPNLNTDVNSWLCEQLFIQEKASKRLQEIRSTKLARANRARVPSSFAINDFVLVHNKRWPQKRFPKLGSQWQGPFKVLKAHFNSLEVMASPSLGGLIDVSTQFCKKWQVENEMDDPNFEIAEVDDDVKDNVQTNLPSLENSNLDDKTMSTQEQQELGFYNMEKNLKHKYRNGWKFSVIWENFPPSASTWEPISNFCLLNGSVNSVFKDFCLENGLTNILQKALSCQE